MVQALSTGTFCISEYVVSPDVTIGNYTTIQDAVDAVLFTGVAQTVYLNPGTYAGFTCAGPIEITSYTTAGYGTSGVSQINGAVVLDADISISGIYFSTPGGSDANIELMGNHTYNFIGCTFSNALATILKIEAGNTPKVNFYQCNFTTDPSSVNTTSLYTIAGNAQVKYFNCECFNGYGAASLDSSNSTGTVSFYNSSISWPASVTGTGILRAFNCQFNNIHSTAVACSSALGCYFTDCSFDVGIRQCVVVTAPGLAVLRSCYLSSLHVNPIAGTGTVWYDFISNDEVTDSSPTSSTVVALGCSLGDVKISELTLTTVLDNASGGTGLDTSSAANGTILIGDGSGFSLANITAGPGVSVANGAGTITISSSVNVSYTEENSTFSALSNEGYYCTGPLTVNLPGSPSNGDVINIICFTAANIIIQANAGQLITMGNISSSVAGTATNTLVGNTISLRYRTSTTTWVAENFVGTWSLA
ncbi:MAG: hypothetical protein KGZ39_00255 [Simkania sp.]|nr:hypothetical protein [Simkania sp.]